MSPSNAGRQSEAELDEVLTAVLVASRALISVAVRSLSTMEQDVTLVQYRALVLLGSRGAQNVSGLAEALNIHPSTATRLLDRLVAKGFVHRLTSLESRREVAVTLTREGQLLLKSVTTRRRKELETILKRLPAERRALLRAAFGAFAEAAGEVPDASWKLGWTS